MKTTRLGEVCSLHYGKGLSVYNDEPDETRLVKVFGTNGPIGWTTSPLYEYPTIVIGRKGAYRGVHFSSKPSWIIDTAYFLTLNSETVDLKWLYYRLLLVDINRMDTGAAIPSTKREDFYSVGIRIPDISLQLQIVDILSAYDDLIDINRCRTQLLEEAARLLFREWFVYFRFPGHGKVKIVDGVPEGWERIRFAEIISTIESGGRPKGGAIEEGVPSIGAENVNGIGKHDYSSEKYVSEEYYQNMKKGKVMSKDVLLYKDGANIGRVTIVGHGFPHKKCCVNEHVFILRTKNNIQNWLYFFLSQEFVQQAVANLNSNSAQPGISQQKLWGLKIIFPGRKLVRLFDDMAEDMVRQIFTLSIQNQKLAQARDLLLPRLMSGKIEV